MIESSYDRPPDMNAPAVKQALCGLLWEEVRPIRRVELSFGGSVRSPSRRAHECLVHRPLRLAAEAEAYRQDLTAAIDRSIARTPVVAVRDGTYRSFIPFAPYVRGFAAGAWGWRRCQDDPDR